MGEVSVSYAHQGVPFYALDGVTEREWNEAVDRVRARPGEYRANKTSGCGGRRYKFLVDGWVFEETGVFGGHHSTEVAYHRRRKRLFETFPLRAVCGPLVPRSWSDQSRAELAAEFGARAP